MSIVPLERQKKLEDVKERVLTELGLTSVLQRPDMPIPEMFGFVGDGSAADNAALSEFQTFYQSKGIQRYGRSDPANVRSILGGKFDVWGAAGRYYLWGAAVAISNSGNAPITTVDGIGTGWKVRGGGFTTRQIGAGGDAHALELISGQWAATAVVATTAGSKTLEVTSLPMDGARFCIGDVVEGTNIPVGATITGILTSKREISGPFQLEDVTVDSPGAGYSVGDILTLAGGSFTKAATLRVRTTSGGGVSTVYVVEEGDYSVAPAGPLTVTGGGGAGATFTPNFITAGAGYPVGLTISVNATGSASTTIKTRGADTSNIACLITGNGDGGLNGDGNANGVAIAIQSYGSAAFKSGVNFGASALRAVDGVGLGFTLTTGQRTISLASTTFENFLRVSSGNFSGRFIEFLTGSTAGLIRVADAVVMSGALIEAPAHRINIGGIGLNVTATSANLLLTDNMCVIAVDTTAGNVTINLPTANVSRKGKVFMIKKISAANTLTIDPSGTQLIDGAETRAVTTQWVTNRIICDGTQWFTL